MMTDADRSIFAAALTELALLKGGKLAADSYEAWWNAMHERWTLAEFRAACAQLSLDSEFMPNPFHFEKIRKLMLPTAGEQWARVRAHVSSLPVCGGFLQDRDTGDPLLDAAARAVGGYKTIAAATERDLQFIERRFVAHYEEIQLAVATRTALPLLAAPAPASHGSMTQLLGSTP